MTNALPSPDNGHDEAQHEGGIEAQSLDIDALIVRYRALLTVSEDAPLAVPKSVEPEVRLMDANEVVERVKELNLQPGTFIVFGSSPLAVAGLRGVRDIDMVVSKEVADRLEKRGWKRTDKGPNDTPIAHDVFEAHTDRWKFSPDEPTLDQLLQDATVVDGVPFVSLKRTLLWKLHSAYKNPGARRKHMADVARIEEYLQRQESK